MESGNLDAIIIVKDWVTKNPIAGARVEISPAIGEPMEMMTDENGEANFGEILTGLYRVTVQHKDYGVGFRRVELPATVQIELSPYWLLVALPVSGIVIVAVAGLTKYAGWW